MNSVIWKYTIKPNKLNEDHETTLELPTGASPFHAHEQGGDVCVWCRIPAGPQSGGVEQWKFKVMPTGVPFASDKWVYLDTAHVQEDFVLAGTLMKGRPLVFHIFFQGTIT